MEVNGIDLSNLNHGVTEYKPPIKGRIAHIDADFLAYQLSYEKEGEEKTWEDVEHNATEAVDYLRRKALAETAVLYLTPKESTKGGRADQAIQAEYQGNRQDAEKPERLEPVRHMLAERWPSKLCIDYEADDAMAANQRKLLAMGHTENSIIVSDDKDLRMVPGHHYRPKRDRLEYVEPMEPYGWLEQSHTGEIAGYGTAWFWFQMLTGDYADGIKGLPMLGGRLLNEYDPTKAVTEAFQILAKPEDWKPKVVEKAEKVLATRKDKKIGPSLAYRVLQDCTNDKEAFALVKEAYEHYGTNVGFTNYRDDTEVKWGKVLVSEGQLLWMRRVADDPNDFQKWLAEITR